MRLFEGLEASPNIHPLFVHFPIALLVSAGILFIACCFSEREELRIVAKWNLILGSLAAVATVITGLIAASTLPHNEEIHEVMEIHEKIMITTAILSLGLGGYLFFKKDGSRAYRQKAFLAGVVLMLAFLAVGADFGGKMVFQYGAGTELFKKMNPEIGSGGHHHHHHHGEAESPDDHADHDHDY